MKASVPEGVDPLDIRVIDYIRMIRFRSRLFGVDVKDLWTVILNIQKYYDEKMHIQKVEYETRLRQKQYEISRLEKQLLIMREEGEPR